MRAGGASIPALRETFAREVRRRNVNVLEHTSAIRLLGGRDGCQGAIAITGDGELLVIPAGATVIATGGYAALFEHPLTSGGLLGEGYALALNIGAELINLEFYQLILGITGPLRGMIIAESTLESLPDIRNGLGERFLERYLPAGVTAEACMAERGHTGPFHTGRVASHFDIALFEEIAAERGTDSGGIRCDFTGKAPGELRGFREDWLQWSLEKGLDVRNTPVDIAPCVHANNGGIVIDINAATRVPGLFACGEAAGGPHGANRIGGNQMSGTQVFGARAGASAARHARAGGSRPADASLAVPDAARIRVLASQPGDHTARQILEQIQQTMYRNLAVRKDEKSLRRALQELERVEGELLPRMGPAGGSMQLALSLPHALQIARLIVQSALLRRESRGPHYRGDFPDRDDSRFGRPLRWSRSTEGDSICSHWSTEAWPFGN